MLRTTMALLIFHDPPERRPLSRLAGPHGSVGKENRACKRANRDDVAVRCQSHIDNRPPGWTLPSDGLTKLDLWI